MRVFGQWQRRLDAFYEERLSFQADQLKILREIYEMKASVQDDRIAMLENRIANLDGWVQTVATTQGLGSPVPVTGETGLDDSNYDPPVDDEADMSFEALFPAYFESADPETESETEVITNA